SDEEIQNARFVPLLAKGGELDHDDEGQYFNSYPTRLCQACGTPDLFVPPDPFIVARPKRTTGFSIWNASNGIRLMTRALWSELEQEISPWVRTGQVQFTEDSPADELIYI